MTTLNEIEKAVDGLTVEQKQELRRYLEQSFQVSPAGGQPANRTHSALDIAPIRIGPVLRPLGDDHDLLGEMLEERR